jgi:hypothetical protein
MIFTASVVKESERDRSVNSGDMFLKIESAFSDNENEICTAVGIGE